MNRQLEKVLISRLDRWRSVALLGPRQVGKSYLLKDILKRHAGTLISMDDPLERKEASRDPLKYIEQRYKYGEYLFIDEAARVPEIFSAVKILIDRHDPKPSGICLANSGNYLLMSRIKESLAGRINLLPVYPFSWQEFADVTHEPGLLGLIGNDVPKSIEPPKSLVEIKRLREEKIIWGGFPTPSLAADRDSKVIWSSDYIRTYIIPLVIEQYSIRDSIAFEQAARVLFTQSAQFFNASRLAQIIGVSQPTAAGYTRQLEAMMVLSQAQVYINSPLKRLIKQPKFHVIDSLFLHEPLGTNFSLQSAIDRNQIGAIYESFIFNEIKKTLVNYDIHAEFFTWRTQDKSEVDIVVSTAAGVIPFEVKWSGSVSRHDASGLNSFLSTCPNARFGFVIHPGETIEMIAENIYAVPDWWLFGC